MSPQKFDINQYNQNKPSRAIKRGMERSTNVLSELMVETNVFENLKLFFDRIIQTKSFKSRRYNNNNEQHTTSDEIIR